MSGASEQGNRRASGPVLQSVFLAVMDHSAAEPAVATAAATAKAAVTVVVAGLVFFPKRPLSFCNLIPIHLKSVFAYPFLPDYSFLLSLNDFGYY